MQAVRQEIAAHEGEAERLSRQAEESRAGQSDLQTRTDEISGQITEHKTALAALAAEREAAFVTLFYGEGVSQEEAEAAQALFTEACPETEVSLLSGGQPVYYYTISIE